MKKSSSPQKPRSKGLASVKGWLGKDDPFFKVVQKVVTARRKRKIRRVNLSLSSNTD